MKKYRVDSNQPEVVKYLREKGVIVKHTHMVGSGFCDIVCGYKGKNFLFEIKDGDKPTSAKQLTAAEKIFHFEWKGQIDVIESGEQAWDIIQKATI
jgi:Holliday junction resolvase